ncbi:hypothetical protein ACFQ1E_10235 [Sphingomonas canadensis]|uniref:Uncharacterized protein n=1 Tax=Sphingomonas canadensis TaxID=1219257 RepID=A0ABW3HAN2_9SPHN|nr:hypothetical protein [Sphingomonas canadensis]MCW3836503.1 hypothetical protein [Sphingomonas canadensis]
MRPVTPLVARESRKFTPLPSAMLNPLPPQFRIVRLSRRSTCSVDPLGVGVVLNVGVVDPGAPPLIPEVTEVTLPVSGRFCAAAGMARIMPLAIAVPAISAARSVESLVMAWFLGGAQPLGENWRVIESRKRDGARRAPGRSSSGSSGRA